MKCSLIDGCQKSNAVVIDSILLPLMSSFTEEMAIKLIIIMIITYYLAKLKAAQTNEYYLTIVFGDEQKVKPYPQSILTNIISLNKIKLIHLSIKIEIFVQYKLKLSTSYCWNADIAEILFGLLHYTKSN